MSFVVISLGDADFTVINPAMVASIKPYGPSPLKKTIIFVAGGPSNGFRILGGILEVAKSLGINMSGNHPALTKLLEDQPKVANVVQPTVVDPTKPPELVVAIPPTTAGAATGIVTKESGGGERGDDLTL